MASDATPIRILHALGGLSRGGIETWLMHVLRNIDRDRFQMDFLVNTDQPQAYDDEARELGARVLHCADYRRPWRWAQHLKAIADDHGPWDVLHTHLNLYNGVALAVGRGLGFAHRIAHSHNDTEAADTRTRARSAYRWAMQRSIDLNATRKLAASRRAAHSLFGPDWADEGVDLLYYGIELEPFEVRGGRRAYLEEFDIDPNAHVIGHVGRFVDQKNHGFLIEIFDRLAARRPDVHLLLVGDGPLRGEVARQVDQRGLADRVTFAGLRDDVPSLMVDAMDVFLFPSLHEGLGIVLVEAQAAGLPCVLSDVVPYEADVTDELLERLSLSAPAARWADVVDRRLDAGPALDAKEALGRIRDSRFNVANSVDRLARVYTETVDRRPSTTPSLTPFAVR